MSKKLVWKGFETFEERDEHRAAWLASLTPEQLEKREITIEAIRKALMNIPMNAANKPTSKPAIED